MLRLRCNEMQKTFQLGNPQATCTDNRNPSIAASNYLRNCHATISSPAFVLNGEKLISRPLAPILHDPNSFQSCKSGSPFGVTGMAFSSVFPMSPKVASFSQTSSGMRAVPSDCTGTSNTSSPAAQATLCVHSQEV